MGTCCQSGEVTDSNQLTTDGNNAQPQTPLLGGSKKHKDAKAKAAWLRQKQEREKRKRCREQAVKELIETEKTYVRLLGLTVTVYMDPLSQNGEYKKLVTPKQHQVLFSDLKTILPFNDKFVKDLMGRHEKWNNNKSKIGDLFLDFCPYFRMYQNYLNNYENATQTLAKLQNTKKGVRSSIYFCTYVHDR